VEDAEIRRPKELTDEQLSRALALANIQLSSQRPDEDLVQRMREKNVASGSQLANGCAPSMGPPSSMLVSSWSHDLAGSLPVPAIDSFKVASTTSQRYDNGDFSTGINTWEDRANKGIAHKTLSLKKVWDHKTWKQKANNLERLKLLKDDGYDIASLQVKGTSADTITVALLAHLKARNERSSDPASAVAAVPLSSTSDEDAVDQDSELSAANELSEEMLQAVPELVQSEAEWRPWISSSLLGIKRKHTHEDEVQPEWHEDNPQKELHEVYRKAKVEPLVQSCSCSMYDKILRTMTREKVAVANAEQAYNIAKRRIGRDVFQYSREARRVYKKPEPPSFGKGASVATWKPSRIVLQSPSSPARHPHSPDEYVSAKAMDMIMNELSCMSYDRYENNSRYITDPDEAEDRESDRLMEIDNLVSEEFRYQIRLFATPAATMVIEGETMALIGLLRRLRESGLSYYHPWQYDPRRVDVIINGGVLCHLSDATNAVLKEAEKALEARKALGGIELRIESLGSFY
jgi:hypothetical protein